MSQDKLNKILDKFPDETFLAPNGLIEALIGVDEISKRLVYSSKKIIDILISEEMTEEDALEHFYYNIQGAYLGEKTPIYKNDLYEEDEDEEDEEEKFILVDFD